MIAARRVTKQEFCALKKSLKIIMGSFHSSKPSHNKKEFRNVLSKAQNIVVLSGAGASAESGIPTFRGEGGLWRKYNAPDLASPFAFKENPSLVWEFYHHRRDVVLSKKPNPAHFAIADLEERFKKAGRNLTVITQNIDGLHQQAGSKDVIELHGSLFKTRCLKCGTVEENKDNPICPALADKGAPDPTTTDAAIPESLLPRCHQVGCESMVRPHVIWFGESLENHIMDQTNQKLDECDLCLLVGTPSVVYPAAGFAPALARRGVRIGVQHGGNAAH